MKYYIYAVAICLLVALGVKPSLAQAGSMSIVMPVSSSFPASAEARATDTKLNEIGLIGSIEIVRTDRALFLHVHALASEGTQLLTLYDPANGIVFRNNTMLLPLFKDNVKVANLIVATDDLQASTGGFFGPVTGLELDTAEIAVESHGASFHVSASIFLRDLPYGALYRLSLVSNDTVARAISADLAASNLTIAEMPVTLEVTGETPKSREAMGFVIVSVEADGEWSRRHDEKNVSLYLYRNGALSAPPPRVLKASDESTVYQTIAPDGGTFALVAAARPPPARERTAYAGVTDALVLGSVLVVLAIALVVMVQRTFRR